MYEKYELGNVFLTAYYCINKMSLYVMSNFVKLNTFSNVIILRRQILRSLYELLMKIFQTLTIERFFFQFLNNKL